MNILRDPGHFDRAGRAACSPEQPISHGRVLAWGLAAALGLSGCAAAHAPTAAEVQSGEAPQAVVA
ncbi:hypothetical protein, partial [Castellaniella sp.]|uniref:hypothetical protein n=1 Tax=Castellaniella sp. TaxID=1955812 RepID=UPI003C796380